MAFTTPIGAYLSNQQAKRQQRAYNDIYSQQQDLLRQSQAFLAPYAQAGQNALNPLSALLTGQVNGNQLSPDQRMGYFQQSPGYQFRLQEGQNALNRLAAARGQLFGSAQNKNTERFAQGLASDEYGNYLSQLAALGGMGQNAATNQANLNTQFAPQLAQLAYGGAFNPFNKGAAFDNMAGTVASAGMYGAGVNGGFGGGPSNISDLFSSFMQKPQTQSQSPNPIQGGAY